MYSGRWVEREIEAAFSSETPISVYMTTALVEGHCATGRKVAGSVPDVIGIFQLHNTSGPTMVLWVKAAGA